VFRDSGLDVKHYRYYDKKNISLDLEGMVDDIKVVLARSYLILGCSSWIDHSAPCLCP
jgi:aspartate aminotransferase